jgi:adenine phosphoribosyltransferase
MDLEERARSLAAGVVRAGIRDVPGFPKPGIVFKDITPLLADPAALALAARALAWPFREGAVGKVLAVEARGFIFGSLVAQELGCGFVPVRKRGKLPHEVVEVSYALEYGTDTLEMHRDALARGERALVVDDVLATGGTADAVCRLAEGVGAEVAGCAFVIELAFLDGRSRLGDRPFEALLRYE